MTAIPGKLRKYIHERDEGRCQRCGRFIGSGPRSVHHRRPRGMGGSKYANTAANLLLLCGTGTSAGGCHAWVEGSRTRAEKYGFLVRQGHDPAAKPVFRYLRSWEIPTACGWVPADPPDDYETSTEGDEAA